MVKAHKLLAAGTATLIAEPALAFAHQGGLGIIVGLVVGAVAYGIVDDIEQRTDRQLTLPGERRRQSAPTTEEAAQAGSKPNLAHRLLVGKSVREAEEAETDDTTVVSEEELEAAAPAEPEEDPAFAHTAARKDVPGVPRIPIEQIVKHILPNSYKLYIGRSLTRDKEHYPAVQISFFNRHLKLIGASQKGKSSMAAALLDIVSRTHDPDHVLMALLDMEDQTSKLFAHLPHIAEVQLGDERVRLHARNREQVLESLGYLLSIMEQRYLLSKLELAQQPILLVYVEEFLALKDYFKRRIDTVRDSEKEQAKADYAQLIFAISELARRGLKARVQLLLCAQVDYRDEDFQEALINITAGMSFAVRTTAAQAAGFYSAELLKRNAIENTVGQAVVETPDCNDLILTPDYDLEQRLLAFEQAELEQERMRLKRRAVPAPLDLRISRSDQEDSTRYTMPALPQQPARSAGNLTLVETNHAQEADGGRMTPKPSLFERALAAYDEGHTTIDALCVALDSTPHYVRPLYTQIKKLRENAG